MKNITQAGKNIREILLKETERLDKEIGLIKRRRKFTASTFTQMLVFGFQSNPRASYTDLAISAGSIGVEISPQGIEQRFTPKAAEFLKRVLAESMKLVVMKQRSEIASLLGKFQGTYLQDSTVISLPKELANIWEGCGGTNGKTAGVKLQVLFEYNQGQLAGVTMQHAKEQDRTSPYQTSKFPKGSLRIEDLGYFSLQRMKTDHEKGVFWITRLKTGTKVYDEAHEEINLMALFQKTKEKRMALNVHLGKGKQVFCRLLMQRVPDEIVAQRLRKLKRKAAKQGRTLSQRQKLFAQWTLVITNVSEEQLLFDEVILLYRVRWQIELLFKLWKKYFCIDKWRSQNIWRILCELYAKLIGVVITQWLFAFLWHFPNRSFFKAAFVIHNYATALSISLNHLPLLTYTIRSMLLCFRNACRVNSRKVKPATFQLLANYAS